MKKILICLILSLFLIGFVSAADLPKFTLPDGFDDVGDGIYIKYDSSKKPNQTFAILKYTEHDAGDFLINDTKYGYTTYNGTNDTAYHFADKKLGEKGSVEIIEIDGNRFIVESWDTLDSDDLDFNSTFKNLVQFNKLNNITPLNLTEILEQELSNQTIITK